ncbi:sugar phosphate isomerase/epimerase family protein [Pontibacillus yanchengensis]|uniref:AP endonuclease n=1 Tax=Pontibacillus yanchengensis Y32 TaxID=1385514 RepID=A0A0A2TFJ3_9BACI|nr:sugar phosphate isomerase/epimerase family protein [Pontibacillus yanchengensis]KGP74627.1 AP endonuclease [Pontibacillus yanchengensis Y32]
MKTSVSMYSLDQYVREHHWDVFDFIQFAKSIGCDGVELLDMYWCEAADIARVVGYLERENMPVAAYDTSNDFVQVTAEERKQQVAKVKRDIDIAAHLDTKVVRIFCGDQKKCIHYSQGLQWIQECMQECVDYAEKRGIQLAIENHGFFAGRSHQVHQMISDINSPYLGCTYDTGNFLLVDESPISALEVLKHHVKHVHFKDFLKVPDDFQGNTIKGVSGTKWVGAIAGQGEVDLQRIIHVLKQVGYTGWYSIEYEGLDDSKESVKKSMSKLMALV